MTVETSTKQRRLGALLLAAILIFAAVVRFHGITRQAVWFDECATVEIMHTSWRGLLYAVGRSENTPPGYYILLKAWCDLFGTSALAIRVPSALAGVATVWILYRVAAYCIGTREGLIAAALLAASRYHIWYSQEARTYVFMLLLALWSCDQFLRMLDEPPKPWRDLWYWLATTLLLYSHLYAVLVIAAQAIHYAYRWLSPAKPRLSPARFGQLQAAAWIVYAMWFPVLKHWFETRFAGFSDVHVSLQDITTSYWIYLCNENRPLMCVAAALFVIGAARKDVRRWLPLLLSLTLIPVIVPVVASILTHPLWLNRYGIAAMAGVYILIACGIARLPKLAAPALTVAMAFGMLMAHDPGWKGPFKAVGAYLAEWMQPGDYVWVNRRADLAPVRYHSARSDVKYRGFWGRLIPMGVPLADPKLRVWFVVSNPLPWGTGSVTINYGHWRVVSQKTFAYVGVFELADGASNAEETYPDEIRLSAKPATHDRRPPATLPAIIR